MARSIITYSHDAVEIRALARGPLDTLSYIVVDSATMTALVIDAPLESASDIVQQTMDFSLAAIVLTHGHWDHTGDACTLAELTGAPVMIGAGDATMLEHPETYGFPLARPLRGMTPDRTLYNGDVLDCGSLRFEVIDLPGHTRGHIGLHEARLGIVFAGDVLFRGGIGRYDLPGGSYDTLMRSISGRLLRLDGNTIVYPGHGERTRICDETKRNPYIQDYLDHFE